MLCYVIDGFANFMDHAPIGLLVLTLLLAGAPLAVLHELGHAAVVLSRLPGRVIVRVGRDEPTTGFALGRVDFQLRPLMRPWRFDAICTREIRGAPLDQALIALGGPTASLAVGIAAIYGSRMAAPASTLHYVIGAIALEAIVTSILCLTPMALADSRGRVLATDGAHVLAALRGTSAISVAQPAAGRSSRAALARPPNPLRKYRSALWLISTIVSLIGLSYIIPLFH